MKNEKSEMERLNKVSNANRPDGYHDVAHKPAAHTPTPIPLPWIAELSTIYSIPVQSAKEIDDGEWTDGSIVGSTIHKEDAAFIVRAVNHHQELIGMLRCVREALAKNVYETGQPGTWATKIDDAIVDQIARAEGR